MLLGSNKIQINQETLKAALQFYFEQEVFDKGKAPLIEGIYDCNAYTIDVVDVVLSPREKGPAGA